MTELQRCRSQVSVQKRTRTWATPVLICTPGFSLCFRLQRSTAWRLRDDNDYRRAGAHSTGRSLPRARSAHPGAREANRNPRSIAACKPSHSGSQKGLSTIRPSVHLIRYWEAAALLSSFFEDEVVSQSLRLM